MLDVWIVRECFMATPLTVLDTWLPHHKTFQTINEIQRRTLQASKGASANFTKADPRWLFWPE